MSQATRTRLTAIRDHIGSSALSDPADLLLGTAICDLIDAILDKPKEARSGEFDKAMLAMHNDALKAEVRDLTTQVEGLTVERDAARVGLENAIATAQQREQDVSDLRVELAACKEERDALRETVEARDKQVDALNRQIVRIGNQRDALKARIEGAEIVYRVEIGDEVGDVLGVQFPGAVAYHLVPEVPNE